MHISSEYSAIDCLLNELNHRYKNRIQTSTRFFYFILLIYSFIYIFIYLIFSVCEPCQEKKKYGMTGSVIKHMLFSHINSKCQVTL